MVCKLFQNTDCAVVAFFEDITEDLGGSLLVGCETRRGVVKRTKEARKGQSIYETYLPIRPLQRR